MADRSPLVTFNLYTRSSERGFISERGYTLTSLLTLPLLSTTFDLVSSSSRVRFSRGVNTNVTPGEHYTVNITPQTTSHAAKVAYTYYAIRINIITNH